jgi:hypothetical protein
LRFGDGDALVRNSFVYDFSPLNLCLMPCMVSDCHNNNRKERSPPPPPKGGNPNGAFLLGNREINFIVGGHQATKSNRQLRSNAREIGHVNTETPQPLRWSEFPITLTRKDHWVHIPNPRTYPLVVNPIVDGTFLPKTLMDGGSSLNIIFREAL